MSENIPNEIWFLWQRETGHFVLAADDVRGGEAYLACLTEKDAKATVAHQKELYGIESWPVKVK